MDISCVYSTCVCVCVNLKSVPVEICSDIKPLVCYVQGGAWTSLLFWVVVLGINITAYLQRRKQAASFGFKEMLDTATSS